MVSGNVWLEDDLFIPLTDLQEFDQKLSENKDLITFKCVIYKFNRTSHQYSEHFFTIEYCHNSISSFSMTEKIFGHDKKTSQYFNSENSYELLTSAGKTIRSPFCEQGSIEQKLISFFESRSQNIFHCQACKSTSLIESSVEIKKIAENITSQVPLTPEEWCKLASNEVSDSTGALTLILDLEAILLQQESEILNIIHTFIYEDHQHSKTEYFFNSELIKSISVFIRYGHKLVVLTNVLPYRIIYRLFFEHGISLLPEQCRRKTDDNNSVSSLIPELNYPHICNHNCLILSSKPLPEVYKVHVIYYSGKNILQDLLKNYERKPSFGFTRIIESTCIESWLSQATTPSEFRATLCLYVTVKDVIVFTDNIERKNLKTKKTSSSPVTTFYYDDMVLQNLSNLAKTGNRIDFFNDSALSKTDFIAIFGARFNNTDSRYVCREHLLKENKSSPETTIMSEFKKYIQKNTYHNALLIHSLPTFNTSTAHCLYLDKTDTFPTFKAAKCKVAPRTSKEDTANLTSPKNEDEWIDRSLMQVDNKSNSQLVLVMDLDDTLINQGSEKGRFKQKIIFSASKNFIAYTLFYDKKALKSIARFQGRGHRIVVMTLGGYLFEDVRRLFDTAGILLEKDDYHNSSDILSEQKGAYLDNQAYAPRAMLFDDHIQNKPQVSFFMLANSSDPLFKFEKKKGERQEAKVNTAPISETGIPRKSKLAI